MDHPRRSVSTGRFSHEQAVYRHHCTIGSLPTGPTPQPHSLTQRTAPPADSRTQDTQMTLWTLLQEPSPAARGLKLRCVPCCRRRCLRRLCRRLLRLNARSPCPSPTGRARCWWPMAWPSSTTSASLRSVSCLQMWVMLQWPWHAPARLACRVPATAASILPVELLLPACLQMGGAFPTWETTPWDPPPTHSSTKSSACCMQRHTFEASCVGAADGAQHEMG